MTSYKYNPNFDHVTRDYDVMEVETRRLNDL